MKNDRILFARIVSSAARNAWETIVLERSQPSDQIDRLAINSIPDALAAYNLTATPKQLARLEKLAVANARQLLALRPTK